MSSLEKEAIVTTKYLGMTVQCPFCNDRFHPEVTVKVSKAEVRNVGTDGLDAVFSVTTDTDIVGVKFEHVCEGPRKRNDSIRS